jgi:predicted ATPase
MVIRFFRAKAVRSPGVSAHERKRNSGQAKVLQEKLHVRVQDYYLNGDDKRTRSDVYRANERHASRETDKLGERGRVLHATATDNYESGRVSWRRGEIHAKG